jgi:hypothetical protein
LLVERLLANDDYATNWANSWTVLLLTRTNSTKLAKEQMSDWLADKLTEQFEATGSLPQESPAFEEDGVKVFGSAKGKTLVECLRAHLGSLNAGDYFALLAYVEMNEAHESALQSMRRSVRDAKRVATCLGFGPRFLHSTGQAYKGGPNSGVFFQITADDAADLAIPGHGATFGVIKAAQARGDFEVLTQRGRRALRVHLGADVGAGLAALAAAIDEALR